MIDLDTQIQQALDAYCEAYVPGTITPKMIELNGIYLDLMDQKANLEIGIK